MGRKKSFVGEGSKWEKKYIFVGVRRKKEGKNYVKCPKLLQKHLKTERKLDKMLN